LVFLSFCFKKIFLCDINVKIILYFRKNFVRFLKLLCLVLLYVRRKKKLDKWILFDPNTLKFFSSFIIFFFVFFFCANQLKEKIIWKKNDLIIWFKYVEGFFIFYFGSFDFFVLQSWFWLIYCHANLLGLPTFK
jgi:hypothetical protein